MHLNAPRLKQRISEPVPRGGWRGAMLVAGSSVIRSWPAALLPCARPYQDLFLYFVQPRLSLDLFSLSQGSRPLGQLLWGSLSRSLQIT